MVETIGTSAPREWHTRFLHAPQPERRGAGFLDAPTQATRMRESQVWRAAADA